jgi:hypothetical protein
LDMASVVASTSCATGAFVCEFSVATDIATDIARARRRMAHLAIASSFAYDSRLGTHTHPFTSAAFA